MNPAKGLPPTPPPSRRTASAPSRARRASACAQPAAAPHERGRERGAGEGARASAGAHHPEEALPLLAREEVRHEAPEDAHDEEVVDAHPHEEGLRRVGAAAVAGEER